MIFVFPMLPSLENSITVSVDHILTLFIIYSVHIKLSLSREILEAFTFCPYCGSCHWKKKSNRHTHTRMWTHVWTHHSIHTHTHTHILAINLQQEVWWRQTMINGIQWRGKLPEVAEDVFWWRQQWHSHLFQYLTKRKLKGTHPCHSLRLLTDWYQPSFLPWHLIIFHPFLTRSLDLSELLINYIKWSIDL